jgi:hypothetical protein
MEAAARRAARNRSTPLLAAFPLVTRALLDGDARVLREARVGLRALAEREHRSAPVRDQALKAAGIA